MDEEQFHKFRWQNKPKKLGAFLLNSPHNRFGTHYLMQLIVTAGRMFSRNYVDIRLWVSGKKSLGRRFMGGPTKHGLTLGREHYLHFRTTIVPKIDEYFSITRGEIEDYEDRLYLIEKVSLILKGEWNP